MHSAFLEKFRRITSGGNYLPEIDGLRFLAIFWVVAWMHLPTIMDQHLFNDQLLSSQYARSVVLEGGQGVIFFFMISGFILALPFIKEITTEGPKVSLKKYYLRRLTRLEPPYMAALLISFAALIFIKHESIQQQLPHLAASAVYIHNVVYKSASSIVGVAWSLEVEVQFYILAPLLCFLFLIRQKIIRRTILLLVIGIFTWYAWHSMWHQPVILPSFICYFLAGMLLADLYVSGHRSILNDRITCVIGMLIIIGLPFIISIQTLVLYVLKFLLLFFVFYLALFNPYMKKALSIQWISIIGGMCYTIYLLHILILSGVVRWLETMHIRQGPAAIILYGSVSLLAVLFFSVIFYRMIEQPCMRRDWWKRKRASIS